MVTKYIPKVSNTVLIGGALELQSLDEKGVFQGDDEVGYFFEQMKEVQNELNTYMRPENYGKKEIQS